MNRRLKPYDLEKAVCDNVTYWHKRAAEVRQILRASDQKAREHPALGIYYLLVVLISKRRLLRRYIRSRFGYSVDDHRVVKPERFPKKSADEGLWLAACFEWIIWEIAFKLTYPTVTRAEEASCLDKDTYQRVRESFVFHIERMPGIHASNLMLDRSHSDEHVAIEALEETQIAWLSGWVGSQISLQCNRRLKHSLEEMSDSQPSMSPQDRLLRELPATTVIELENLQRDGERYSHLARRVARHLEKGGNQSDYLQRKGKLATASWSDAPMGEPMLEAFLLKEEINALRARAHLPTREDQVLELMLRGHLDREIADILKMAEGSVKSLKSRIRQRLKAAASL